MYLKIESDPDMLPISKHASPSVIPRILIERTIAREVVDRALKAGYAIGVDNGGEDFEYKGTDRKQILHAMFQTDDERLYLFKKQDDKAHSGWVYFVYGNSGYDVISDYTTNLDKLLKPVFTLAETFGG